MMVEQAYYTSQFQGLRFQVYRCCRVLHVQMAAFSSVCSCQVLKWQP